MKSALQKIPLKLLIRQPVMFDANIFMVGIENRLSDSNCSFENMYEVYLKPLFECFQQILIHEMVYNELDSLWHIFRIEDIVAHSLIQKDEEIFFLNNYKERINAPVITTGNELSGRRIADFSKELNIEQLYQYIEEVKESTERIVKNLAYQDLKRKFGDEDKNRLRKLQVVSTEEQADWLIDYWCGKDIRGLIQMPFSRHWIMHIEACRRIENKIVKASDGETSVGDI